MKGAGSAQHFRRLCFLSGIHQPLQEPGNPVLIVAFRNFIRGRPDIVQGVADGDPAAALKDGLHVIIVVAEEHRPGRIDPERVQHIPDAVPFGGGAAHHLEQFPLGHGKVGIIRQADRQLICRDLRMAGENFIDFLRPGKIST